MSNAVSQNYSNHTRFDPLFHFFALPVFAITLIMTIVHLFRRPGLHSAWMVIVMPAALVLIFKVRLYALKVQDRVIRLEERLRVARGGGQLLCPRIGELTESQLIGLRFASDAELPALAARALSERLSRNEIKKAVQQWRPDYW